MAPTCFEGLSCILIHYSSRLVRLTRSRSNLIPIARKSRANVRFPDGPTIRWRGHEGPFGVDLSRPVVVTRTAGIGASRPLPRVAANGLLPDHRAGVQAWRRELVFMPLSSRWREDGERRDTIESAFQN